jgi:D-alanine--poly(phosphoribitol) ligase subunit 2
MAIGPEPILHFFASRGTSPVSLDRDAMDVNLLESGVVDSVGILELVLYLEERFDVRFGPEDLESPAFQTMGGIVELIERRRAA